MHARILEAVRGYLDGEVTARGLIRWVMMNLRHVMPSCDPSATFCMGQLVVVLYDFEHGAISETALRGRLAHLCDRTTGAAVYREDT